MIKNLDKINIIKREKILKGLKFVEKCNKNDNVVDKIYLFGSSIRNDCTEESDIDICYVSKYCMTDEQIFEFYWEFPDVVNDSCDIISFNESNREFQSKIFKTGILIYEYNEDKR